MLSLNTRKQKELDKQRDSFEARKAKARQEMDRKRKLAENVCGVFLWSFCDCYLVGG